MVVVGDSNSLGYRRHPAWTSRFKTLPSMPESLCMILCRGCLGAILNQETQVLSSDPSPSSSRGGGAVLPRPAIQDSAHFHSFPMPTLSSALYRGEKASEEGREGGRSKKKGETRHNRPYRYTDRGREMRTDLI